jgi:hypothetical protein
MADLRPVLLVAVVLLALAPGGGAAVEDPRFETYVPEPTLTPGTTQQLAVVVVNDAAAVDEQTRTARNVKATLLSPGPIEVESGTRLAGNLPQEQPRRLSFTVTTPANASGGNYTLPLRLTYEYGDGERETVTVPVTVRIEERPRFRVVGVESDAQIGDEGPVTLSVRNVGNEAVDDATVTLASQSSALTVGGSASAARFVGAWAAGETRTVTFDATASPDAERREYALTATVGYEDDGANGQSRPLSVGVTPGPEQSFDLERVNSTLRVGEDGTVTATITNDGPDDVSNVVVRLRAGANHLHPLETEFAVESLAAGESANVSFPVAASESATAGPRQIELVAEYESGSGQVRESRPLLGQVAVDPARDAFVVEPKTVNLTAGGSATVTLSVTNNGDATLQDINAKAFVDDPLSAADDEAFLRSLEPGESAEVSFKLSAAESALVKDYPLAVDFQYRQPDGDTRLSDTYEVPVEVTAADGGGTPLGLVGGALAAALALIGGGYWYLRG